MDTIYELIKNHSSGKGEDMMWKTTVIISDAIEKDMPKDAKNKLYYDLYGLLSGGHYDRGMAEADIEKMYYIDEMGEKHHGPYLTEDAVMAMYRKVKSIIPAYNEWDFDVTLHMIVSDNYSLIMKWFPNATADERADKFLDMAINWLTDQDWPSKDRIWHYLHSN